MIEVQFVSPPSEARPRPGDLCQMVESIAFFEAYRPVLEGLKMMSYGEFPLQVHYLNITYMGFTSWKFIGKSGVTFWKFNEHSAFIKPNKKFFNGENIYQRLSKSSNGVK